MSELCADAMWLPSEKKKRIKEMLNEELPEPKDIKEALVEITGETRIPVEFRPCPDCGCNKYPYLSRSLVCANGKPLYVKAECYRCGWETYMHKNVKECAKEWNEAEV